MRNDNGDQDDLILGDGTRMKRVPTDEDGRPIGPYDARVDAANLGGPPIMKRVGPPVRLIRVLEPIANSQRRVVVAFQRLRIFPIRDGIDIPDEGHQVFISTPRLVPRRDYPDVIPTLSPDEDLWEVAIAPD